MGIHKSEVDLFIEKDVYFILEIWLHELLQTLNLILKQNCDWVSNQYNLVFPVFYQINVSFANICSPKWIDLNTVTEFKLLKYSNSCFLNL